MKKNNISSMEQLQSSYAFVLAAAVSKIYPDVQLGESGLTENGFYYDFKLPMQLSQKDLPALEEQMRQIIRSGQEIRCSSEKPEQIRKLFELQPYKLELIDLSCGGTVFSLDNFKDINDSFRPLSIDKLDSGAFKLTGISGAYWKGNADGDMLTRISGAAFKSKEQLQEFLQLEQDRAKRDHRNLGVQLDLFSSSPEIGQGLALWHPKGAMVRYQLEKFSQQAHIMNGYDWVYTPHIGRADLWKTSGHLSFYKDSMYNPILIDNEEYYLKPMNCPFHIAIYQSSKKSYRDLPLRYAEFGTVYRYELSGTLQGLTRVRGFTQDDAHIICTPDQMQDEVLRALKFSLYILRSFGLDSFKAYISTRPEHKSIGEQKDWDDAIEALKRAVLSAGLPYDIDEGGGAFYGPKIDLKLFDALGREWQCSTIQFDFNLPARFKMAYVDSDGKNQTPMMVHRALFGSLERFFAMLIEHYNGEFPFWLAPVQIGIVPIRESQNEYASKITKYLKSKGFRVKLDTSGDQMRAKIRRMELDKLPLIFVIGDKEIEQNGVSVRSRREINGSGIGNLGFMNLETFMSFIEPEIQKGLPKFLDD